MCAVPRVWRFLCAAPVFLPVWVLILASCATAPVDKAAVDARIRDFTYSYPHDSRPVFVGFSPRLQDRKDEEAAAVADAALKAARYGELTGSVVFAAKSRGSFSSVAVDYRFEDDPNHVSAAESTIELADSLVTASGTVVRCLYPGAPELRLPPAGHRDASGRPVWLEKTPEYAGYLTSVGSAEKRRLVGDSFQQADYSALAGILSQTSLLIDADERVRTVPGAGTITRNEGRQTARGTLRGFYVLDRWISDDGRTFYSLAVCPLVD